MALFHERFPAANPDARTGCGTGSIGRRVRRTAPGPGTRIVSALLCGLVTAAAHAAEFHTLKGHGGPIMDIAVGPSGARVATASFDNSVGLWNGLEPAWLEGHEAAVNVVAFVDDDLLVSAGDDFSLIVWNWRAGTHRRLRGHEAKVRDLAVSPDRTLIASASWDGRIGLWPVAGGEPGYLEGSRTGVNAVAFSHDGRTLYSASVDGSVRAWDVAGRVERRLLVRRGLGVNEVLVGDGSGDGAARWLAYGTVNGMLRVIDPDTGDPIADLSADRGPVLALARDRQGRRLARGDGAGFITIYDTATWRVEREFQAALRGPIWALAFSADGETIFAGGIENIVYAWPIDILSVFAPMADSEPPFLRDPDEMSNGERQFARKCSVCHVLTADGGRRAGPSLHGLFGRRAGSLPGYAYSQTLRDSTLVWNEHSIDRLFDIGPDHFVPGSKMPMQRITGLQDRRDLIEFLKQNAR